jgi:hypothetical protein
MIKRLFLVKVLPGSRLVAFPGQRRPSGYFQRFGVTANDENEMLAMIRNHVQEEIGGSITEVENQGEPDFEDLDLEIKHVVGNLEERGFWYVSGHAFYLNEDEGADPQASQGLPS